jgi:DNA-binding NtrC family response regulator
VTDGPDRGAERVCDGAELAVGTARANHLVLTDPAVSRHHFVLAVTPLGVHLRDLGSTNGTFLAGHRLEAAYVKSGSVIVVGVSTLRFDSLEEEIREPLSAEDRVGAAIGSSVAMRRLFAVLPRLAASDVTILIEGETGTGKGLIAEALHEASGRAAGPFVVVDLGAIAPSLIESELFGHEKGAFTNADTRRIGAFESAQGGTLFLDELGELPLDLQPKLLRVLEERTIRRVGGNERIRLDMRVIAATNRDLRKAVNSGRFRMDLFYRLDTVRLRMPALRERREDIPGLIAHFHAQFDDRGAPPAALVASLQGQDWPGNVRELRAAVERAVLFGDPALQAMLAEAAAPRGTSHGPTDPEDEACFAPGVSFRAAKERLLLRWESWYVAELYRRNGGNLTQAARTARMDRTHLRELLKRSKLDVPE